MCLNPYKLGGGAWVSDEAEELQPASAGAEVTSASNADAIAVAVAPDGASRDEADAILREQRRGGMRETLEPRVMQLRVALTQAGGRVISRDETGEIIYMATVLSDTNIDLLALVKR